MRPSSSAGAPRRRCATIGDLYRGPSSGARILVGHKPAGIAVLVTPWNFPAAMATRKIGPALAAGCPVILKPASATPLTMLALMPILEKAGVPKGVVSVLPSRSPAQLVDAHAARRARARRLLHRLDRGRPQAAASPPPTTSSRRRWSSAATRPSSCSTTPTSTPRSTARSSPRCATSARPAPRPTASTCTRRCTTPSPRSSPTGWAP